MYNLGSSEGLSSRQRLSARAPLAVETGHAIRLQVLLRPFDVPANVLDCAKLRQETGWRPGLTFAAALPRTWAWYARQWVASAAPN